MTNDLMAEFPNTSAKEWLAQIAKDLKGRAPGDMSWSPDGELRINPYVHADDISQGVAALVSFGNWKIGESFTITDSVQSNRMILDALNGGVESMHISCSDEVRWEDLLADVELPLIYLGVQIDGDIGKGLRDLLEFTGKKYKTDELRITIYLSNRNTSVPSIPGFPNMRYCATASTSGLIAEGLVEVICNALDSPDSSSERLTMRDLSVSLGMHYLVEIARLRALRILWMNVSEALQFSISSAFAIEAYTTMSTSDDDSYHHMIRSTVMGVAAVLGGADRIYIHPAIGEGHSDSFYRHIARNIHHLLRFESKLTEIPDPVAGAYYIDHLTNKIVESAWKRLLVYIKESGR